MNQSNKKHLEFIKNSGVNYFLQDTSRNWFESEQNSSFGSLKDVNNEKLLKIQQIVEKIKVLDTQLKNTAKTII